MERVIDYAGSTLPGAVAVLIGVAAFKVGLRRWGKEIKLPLLPSFFILWGAIWIGAFLGGEAVSRPITFVALGVLVAGILFWLVSLVAGIFRRR